MFDFAWSEIALVGIVGLLFIGPKDMPVAIRTVTSLLKKGRKLAGEFQTHVDEMVREADLGEARDQLRQLRSLNVRGQIMRALDEDGSIKRTLTADPLAPSISAPRPYEGAAGRPVLAAPAITQNWQPPAAPELAVDEDAAAAASDPAPRIMPPAVSRRLRTERAQPQPPRFVPPRGARTGDAPRTWRDGPQNRAEPAMPHWRLPHREALPELSPAPPSSPSLPAPPMSPPASSHPVDAGLS